MWIFTKDGFYSIVQHKDEADKMMVRTRVREDLETAFGAEGISENEGSDYRFRKTVSKLDVATYLATAVLDIDYTSVKDNIDQGESDRHKMLYQVWGAHYDLQRSRYGLTTKEDDFYDLIWKNQTAADESRLRN